MFKVGDFIIYTLSNCELTGRVFKIVNEGSGSD